MSRKTSRKAVAYLRVSGPSQVRGHGLPRQRQRIAAYAKRVKLEVVETFEDQGVSGTLGLADRPGLSALLSRILANGITTVLVEKADRLARDLIESELILRELRAAGVRVVEAENGTDLTEGDESNATAKLIRQVLGAVAEFEKTALVGKLRAARARKRRETGRCEGPRPYGDLPGEAEVVATMRRLRRKPRGGEDGDRLSFGQVADRLNELGHPTRSGRPWNRGTVHKVLSR